MSSEQAFKVGDRVLYTTVHAGISQIGNIAEVYTSRPDLHGQGFVQYAILWDGASVPERGYLHTSALHAYVSLGGLFHNG